MTDKERIIARIPELTFQFLGRANVPEDLDKTVECVEGLDQAVGGGLRERWCKSVLRQMLHKAGLEYGAEDYPKIRKPGSLCINSVRPVLQRIQDCDGLPVYEGLEDCVRTTLTFTEVELDVSLKDCYHLLREGHTDRIIEATRHVVPAQDDKCKSTVTKQST